MPYPFATLGDYHMLSGRILNKKRETGSVGLVPSEAVEKIWHEASFVCSIGPILNFSIIS